MSTDRHCVEAARRLRIALDGVAGALTAAKVDDLVAAEGHLATAVAAWAREASSARRPSDSQPFTRDELLEELRRLRASLDHCRRLGAALNAFAGASLSTMSSSAPAGYGPAGSSPFPVGRRSWEARA